MNKNNVSFVADGEEVFSTTLFEGKQKEGKIEECVSNNTETIDMVTPILKYLSIINEREVKWEEVLHKTAGEAIHIYPLYEQAVEYLETHQ